MVVIAGSKKKHTEVPNTVDDGQQITRKNLQRSAHWKIKVVSTFSHLADALTETAKKIKLILLQNHVKYLPITC